MLRSLSIQNLAVIEDVQVELDPGFNCFTGATGAGKSLVVGALELLLGLRASSDMVRAGAREARVSALFEIANPDLRREIERTIDQPIEEGQMVILRRIPAEGSSRASLNGEPITASMLRRLGQFLIDIHGQFDQQYLLHPANQLDVLDAFGKLHDLRTRYHDVWLVRQNALQRKTDLQAGRELRNQQIELYEFQAEEIDRAALRPGEMDELDAVRSRLANAERLAGDLEAVYQGLYESEASIVDRLKAVVAVLDNLLVFDSSLEPHSNTARDGAYALEDLAFQIRAAAQRIESDPRALAEAEERLHALRRLCDKYGPTETDIQACREDLGQKLASLRGQVEDESQIDTELAKLECDLLSIGQDLQARRKKAAAALQKKIEPELKQLAMKESQFWISVTPAVDEGGRPAPSPSGLDQVEFMIAPNPGEPAKPLRRIASGGELSRVMLALKGVVALTDRVSVLVFDEIDSNVGGRLGTVIGRKLAELARHHQVLCITHLPQIASFAGRQITVRKESKRGRSFTNVEAVTGDRRIAELAEMIGGKDVTETTRKQARELLELAGQ